MFGACPFGAERFVLGDEVFVENGQGDVGQQRREDPALGRAGDRLPGDVVLGEDASPQECLHQSQDSLISDPTTHPTDEGRMIDLVEACRDVGLEHPLVIPIGRSEVMNLGDGVLGSALRAEAIGAWLEVRFEDRLEHQLQGGLHYPVGCGRDPQASDLARSLGDRLLPHPNGTNRRDLR